MRSNHCNFCLKKFKSKPKKQGKISRRKHLVLEQQRFDCFWNLYQAALPKYVFHRWKYLVLGKKITTNVRQSILKNGEVGKCLTKKSESTLVGHLCDIKKKSKAILKNSKPVSDKKFEPLPSPCLHLPSSCLY